METCPNTPNSQVVVPPLHALSEPTDVAKCKLLGGIPQNTFLTLIVDNITVSTIYGRHVLVYMHNCIMC